MFDRGGEVANLLVSFLLLGLPSYNNDSLRKTEKVHRGHLRSIYDDQILKTIWMTLSTVNPIEYVQEFVVFCLIGDILSLLSGWANT